MLERRLDLGPAFQHRSHQVECTFEIDRTILQREYHRLFRRQAEALLLPVEGDIAVGRLRQRPFTDTTFGKPGSLREFGRAGRTVAMQRIEQSEPKADAGRG